MSIETEFESTITNVKNAYQGLDNLGATIPQNKTIENIKSCLDEIYNKLPKTSYAEGSNITLSNTLKGKLDFEDGIVGIGDTSQEGTPTPDSPQEIEVVRGKNRFNKDNFESYNGFVDITTKKVNYNASVKSIIIGCESNTTYTVQKLNGGNYDRFSISSFTSKPTVNSVATNVIGDNSAKSLTITSGTSDKYLMILYYNTNETTHTESQILDSIMLEKGSQATSYLPYNTIEVVERGKNLFNVSRITEELIDTTSGTISTNDWWRLSDYMPVKSNTNYNTSWVSDSSFFQMRIAYYNSNKEFISGENFSQNYIYSKYFTTPNNTAYCRINYSVVLQSTPVSRTNIQFEEGSTTTNFEPYQEPKTYQLSLGEYEFAKIENYVDTIEYDVENDKVYKNENANEHIFTENENISLQSINSYGIANFFIPHSLGSVSNFALCNYFTLQTSGISVTQEEGFLWQHNGVYFRIKSSTASDVSSFKTWLNFHSVKVEYALAETNKEEITGTLKDQIKALYNSHSFTGTTIIEIDGQLPLIIKVRALKGE